jgi:hypothetical protein
MPSATQLAREIHADLWRRVYAPAARAAAEAEATRQAEDFVEGPRPVGPWLLRPLTAYDLLISDGYECPLTAGDWRDTAPAQLHWFAWLLRADMEAGDFARWRFIRRMRRRHRDAALFAADLAATAEYVERHFADASAPKRLDPRTGQPVAARAPGTNWLAPLVVGLACETGWTEQQILSLPLGRLWQYLRILDQRKNPGAPTATALAKAQAACLAETERVLQERVAAEATPATAATAS